jgi:hypothetical protein
VRTRHGGATISPSCNLRQSKPARGVLRWGSRGSLVVDARRGVFNDFEANRGGGVLDLIVHVHGGDYRDAREWLRGEGFLGLQPPTAQPRPFSPKYTGTKGRVLKKSTPRIVTRYPYFDEVDELLYEVIRFDPKDFRQRRPDGQGAWVWGLAAGSYERRQAGSDWYRVDEKKPVAGERHQFGETRRVLYRLPELVEAVAHEKPVFIVEGEKDVEMLRHHGIAATTNLGGAEKWRPEYNKHLRGADVVIVPDNDEGGRRHARAVAGSLQGTAVRIRVIELPGLPEKGDVSDWFVGGGSVEQFWHLVEQTHRIGALSYQHLTPRRPPVAR